MDVMKLALLLVALCGVATTSAANDMSTLTNAGRAPLSQLLRLLNKKNSSPSTESTCPPNGYDSVKNFDLPRFINAPWYVQKQIPTTFQSVDTLYCVRAEYVAIDPSKPLTGGVIVKNYSNRGAVNGPPTGTSGAGGSGSFAGRFLASVPNVNDPSKLNVGFALGNSNTPTFGAPYWVVAVSPDYQWAIITGGAAGVTTPSGKCSSAGGFWFFSRTPVDPSGTAAMTQEAERLGLDTSVLLDVPQAGCQYVGA